ncbi:MAG: response regulator [Geovibrio sp.]|nr:response regulator [Geovibrio sp.]
MNKIKVVIVDDSAFMRKAIESMLAKDSEIEIVGQGRNGLDAVEMARNLKPDVMTLDIEMPRMDGLSALEKNNERESSARHYGQFPYHRGCGSHYESP